MHMPEVGAKVGAGACRVTAPQSAAIVDSAATREVDALYPGPLVGAAAAAAAAGAGAAGAGAAAAAAGVVAQCWKRSWRSMLPDPSRSRETYALSICHGRMGIGIWHIGIDRH